MGSEDSVIVHLPEQRLCRPGGNHLNRKMALLELANTFDIIWVVVGNGHINHNSVDSDPFLIICESVEHVC